MKKMIICFALVFVGVINISESVVFASDNTHLLGNNKLLASNDTANNVIDIEKKKYEIACDRTLQRNLATLADSYGFGWCGGTRSGYVGEDFDVYKEGDNYVIKGHYDPKDPYAKGYRASETLKITLSNFRYRVDPHSVNFKTPIVKKFEPKSIDTVTLINNRDTKEDVTLNLQYSQADCSTHSSNYKFSEGLKLASKFKLKIPFVGETEDSIEFSFGAEQGWTDTTSNTVNKTLAASVNCKDVQPNHQAEIEALLASSQCDVPYTATAEMVFDVSFNGFLAWSGNAAGRTDRPTVTKTFGDGDETYSEAISRLYEHRNIPSYDSNAIPNDRNNGKYVWDWAWMQKKCFRSLDELVGSIQNEKFTFDLSGTFTKVSGNNITIKTLADKPITEAKKSDGLMVRTGGLAVLKLQAEAASGNPVIIKNSQD